MAKSTFTDPVITANVSGVRGVHIRELQAAINRWLEFYGQQPMVFTTTVVDDQTPINPAEIVTELRQSMEHLKGSGMNWTDSSIVTFRKPYIDELRLQMNDIEENHCHSCDSCDGDGPCPICDGDICQISDGNVTIPCTECDGGDISCGCDYPQDWSCACESDEICAECDGGDISCGCDGPNDLACVCEGDLTLECTCDGDSCATCDGDGPTPCEACDGSYNRV